MFRRVPRCKQVTRIICMAVQVSTNRFGIPGWFKDAALNVIFGFSSWSADVFDVIQNS